jgi:hypothetical protein
MTISLLAFNSFGQAEVLSDFETDASAPFGMTIVTTNPDPGGGARYAQAKGQGNFVAYIAYDGISQGYIDAMHNPLLVFDYNTGDNKGFMQVWIYDGIDYYFGAIGHLHSSDWKQMVVPIKEYFSMPDFTDSIYWHNVSGIGKINFFPWQMPAGSVFEVNIDNIFLKAESQTFFDFEDGIKPQELPDFTIETINPDTTGGLKYLKVAKSDIAQWSWIGAAEKQIPMTNLKVYNKPLVSFLYNTGAKKGYLQVEVGDNANMKWGYSVGQLESAVWTSMDVSLFDVSFSNWATDPLDWSKVKYIKIGFTTGDLDAGSDYEISIDNIKLKESPRNYEPLLTDFSIMEPLNEDLQFLADWFMQKFTDPENDTLVNIKIVTLPDAKSGVLLLDTIPVAAGKELGVADIGKLKFTPTKDWWGTCTVEWTASDGENYPDEAMLNIIVSHSPNVALNKKVESSRNSINRYSTLNMVYANDGYKDTRWQDTKLGSLIEEGKYADTAWIYVDLGVPLEISAVVIYWEAAYAIKYLVEVSDDAVAWTPVGTIENGNGNTDSISLSPVTARYVRIYTMIGNFQWCPSIYELEVYNKMPQSAFPVNNIVFGRVDNGEDYLGIVNMSWDNDSVYMLFEIKDDSIVTTGNAWQVDNIEIYFDMDNSKNIHWPRNGGWIANDPTLDEYDHQLRLVPTMPWEANNSLHGVRQVYTRMANGYNFTLNIPWDSLMSGFIPEVGKEIGFDLLVSDNDAAASDANRNQITWNAPTVYPFNDPCIWGTLQLAGEGAFVSVPDKGHPTPPSNLVATVAGSTALLTWDPSSDNVAVHQYILFRKLVRIDTILAKQTGNSYMFNDLPAGESKLSVMALDLYRNGSALSTITVTVTGIKDETVSSQIIYPNPACDVIYLGEIMKEKAVVEIYKFSGQLMMSCRIDAGESEINIAALPQGMYTIRLSDSKEVRITKLIKN